MYCSKCGGQVLGGTAFCPACGQPTLAATPQTAVTFSTNPAATSPGYPVAAQSPSAVHPTSRVAYAGFWLRFVAYIIDSIIVGVAFMALFIPFAMVTGLAAVLSGIHPGQNPKEIGALLGPTFFLGIFSLAALAFLGGWIYHAKMESSSWQATLGKKALNLRVTDMNGNRVTFNRATGRHFAKLITGLIPLGVGFILAGLTEKRQALHDMLASCLVLRDV